MCKHVPLFILAILAILAILLRFRVTQKDVQPPTNLTERLANDKNYPHAASKTRR